MALTSAQIREKQEEILSILEMWSAAPNFFGSYPYEFRLEVFNSRAALLKDLAETAPWEPDEEKK
jgi:hypothetical protein